MTGKASLYIAGDIRREVPKIPASEIAALIVALVRELSQCRVVTDYRDATIWCHSLADKEGRQKRFRNEIGRQWRGKLAHYDALEKAVMTRAVVVTEDEMKGLFAEITF